MGNPYSNMKIFRHVDYLNAIEEGDWRAPIYVRIKPTNICNHHCAYCTYGSGNTLQKTGNRDFVDHLSMIPWKKMSEILDDFIEMGVKAVTFSGGGEPLTYPYIDEAMNKIREKIDVSLITNGELLDGKRAENFYDAEWVRISFDSPNEEEYCRLRGLKADDFKRVVTNISEFAKRKSEKCALGVNYVVSKDNYKRIYEASKFLKSLGVENIKFAAMVDNKPNHHLSIKDEAIEQLNKAIVDFEDGNFRIINNYETEWNDKNFTGVALDTCYTCRLITVIGADQRVYLCHTKAYDSQAIVGDLSNIRFKDMWYSEETRNRLLFLKPKEVCRNHCVYESRNRVIQSYFDATQHVNFV